MPYQTSPGNGYTQAANTIAKIFVGDPVADAEYRNQQIKNETEFARQKYLQEQAVSEGVRRTQMQAAAAANQALADQRQQEVGARTNLGNIFTNLDDGRYDAPSVQSVRDSVVSDPNFFPSPEFAAPIDAAMAAATPNYEKSVQGQLPNILANIMTGGIDPKVLSGVAALPGVSDDTIGRLMVGAGNFIGKDDYVSIDDRNKNRNYELGGNERLVDGAGNVTVGLDPTQSAANTALANQRNAAAGAYNTKAAGGGGKVPKLDQRELNRFIREAILSRGAEFDISNELPSQYLSGQPDLYANMSRLIDEAYRSSGGRASAVQDALGQYLNGVSFSNFRTPASGGVFGVGGHPAQYNQIEGLPDIQTIIDQLGTGIQPEIFTEGGNEDLPNLQNVGNANGQWKILEVR